MTVPHPRKDLPTGMLRHIYKQTGRERKQAMLYLVYVHVGEKKHAHGVTFPDFPGCFSAADSWEKLPANIQEAAELHFEGEALDIPPPTPLEKLTSRAEFQDGVWMSTQKLTI